MSKIFILLIPTLPAINIIQNLFSRFLPVLREDVLSNPGNQVILEDSLDKLMQDVG